MSAAFAWTNIVKTAVLTASSADPALPVTNLNTSDLGATSTGWQTLAGAISGVVLTITPAARTTFRAIGVFRTNRTSAGTVAYALKTNPGPATVASGNLAMAGQNGVVILGADTPADFITLTFTDAANPDNHLNIPQVFAGPAWVTTGPLAWTSAIGLDDITDEVVSRGGQRYEQNRAVGRRWEIAFESMRQAEVWTQWDALDRASRLGGNVMVVPDLLSATLANETCFGTLRAADDLQWPYQSADRRGWRARLLERL